MTNNFVDRCAARFWEVVVVQWGWIAFSSHAGLEGKQRVWLFEFILEELASSNLVNDAIDFVCRNANGDDASCFVKNFARKLPKDQLN
jgi:hypothetical protein